MKRRKFKIVLFVIPMLLLFTTIGVSASTWSSSIKVTNLPTWGGVKDLNVSHKKQTTTQVASFYTTQVSATLPTFAHIRNSNGALRSGWGYLIKGAVYTAKEYDAEKGYLYYPSVKTSDYEFGSGNSVTFKFSSDYMN